MFDSPYKNLHYFSGKGAEKFVWKSRVENINKVQICIYNFQKNI